VLVYGTTGVEARIEIKAQLTRPNFTDIQNTDWVRDATDFLGEVLTVDEKARGRLPPRRSAHLIATYDKEDGWDLGALWVADIAGIKNKAMRHCMGVTSRALLTPFLASTYLLQVTARGLRLYRLSDFPNLSSALDGHLRYARDAGAPSLQCGPEGTARTPLSVRISPTT
jgi:hypothetical protein